MHLIKLLGAMSSYYTPIIYVIVNLQIGTNATPEMVEYRQFINEPLIPTYDCQLSHLSTACNC